MSPAKTTGLTLLVGVFIASWISPLWPYEQALHSSLTVVALVLCWRLARQNTFSDLAFCLICVFVAAHCVASRWLYSNVPYDHWIHSWSGVSLQQAMGWQRNHFDRLVHFLYGFCLAPALVQQCQRQFTPDMRRSFALAVGAIMISSLCYEWLEWLLAVFMSAQDAEAYNGQQGDMWDAHKDMLLATLGALAWAPRFVRSQRHETSHHSHHPGGR